jgi:hypothetical protein
MVLWVIMGSSPQVMKIPPNRPLSLDGGGELFMVGLQKR